MYDIITAALNVSLILDVQKKKTLFKKYLCGCS